MTLILTLMRPGEGIWQTVDARITRAGQPIDDFASKQLTVHSWDGTLIVSYTGAAELRSGERMFDWLRSTLRGENRTSENHVLHLQERITRDFGRSSIWRHPLIFNIVGVLGTRPDPNMPLENRRMVRWRLTNEIWPEGPQKPTRVVRDFELFVEWVDQPRGWADGSGIRPLERLVHDIGLLRRATTVRPNKPLDYLGLLAAVNRRIAPRSNNTVSPWCSGTYMPEIGQELRSIIYTERGDPQGPPRGTESIVMGFDTTDLMRHMQTELRNRQLGLPPPPPVPPGSAVEPRP